MSAVFDNNSGKTLSTTSITGIAAQTHNRLMTAWVKPTTLNAFDIHMALENAGGTMAQELTNWAGGEFSGYWSPDDFTTEWEAPVAAAGTGVWQLWGCYMPANANGASLTLKSYMNATSATGTETGTTHTGNLTTLSFGYGFAPPACKMSNGAVWVVANQAAADAIVAALQSGGPRRADSITATATPNYYWPLLSDGSGTVSLTNTGSVAFDSDEPVWVSVTNNTFRALLGVGR